MTRGLELPRVVFASGLAIVAYSFLGLLRERDSGGFKCRSSWGPALVLVHEAIGSVKILWVIIIAFGEGILQIFRELAETTTITLV